MATVVFDCPACSASNSTFDLLSHHCIKSVFTWFLFSVCRACNNSVVINAQITEDLGYEITGNQFLDEEDYKQIYDFANKRLLLKEFHINNIFGELSYSPILPNTDQPPEYLPKEVESIFKEAAKCLSIGCFNAAGAMFRLCLDSVTKKIVEQNEELNPTSNDKKSIHNRLVWIFMNNILPSSLEDLSRCIKDNGNDAAHDGSLTREDAEDLLDFSYILLERVYTEPYRIAAAIQKRSERRNR